MQSFNMLDKHAFPFFVYLALLVFLVMLSSCASSGDDMDNDDNERSTNLVVPESGGTIEDMVALINEARGQDRDCGDHGFFDATGPVTWDDRISEAALLHSTDMATNEHFDHTGTDGSSAGDRITDEGYVWRTWGENIAVGYDTIEAVVNAWLNSPGHCANIMYSQFTQMGAAAVRGDFNGSEELYWTLNFATPR